MTFWCSSSVIVIFYDRKKLKNISLLSNLMHLWLPLAIACEVYFVKLEQTENLFCFFFCLCNENKNLSSFTSTLLHSNHLMLLDFSVSIFAFIWARKHLCAQTQTRVVTLLLGKPGCIKMAKSQSRLKTLIINYEW